MLSKDKIHISGWLFASAALVFLMVIIGGLTRLTESGLSIIDWNPVTGAIPPLSDNNWQELFNAYQTSPQYQKINSGMSLIEFKNIFWLEYIHRLLGRIAGLVFVLPLLFFIFAKKLGKPLAIRLSIISLLWGTQGFIGWYMVKSGLIDNPAVSHYRLALHLALAFILYALLFITGLELKTGRNISLKIPLKLGIFSLAITFFILFQAILGAFVAGTHAGLIYNSFPLMGDHFIPPEVFFMKPFWLNFLANPAMLQFQHRIGALFLFLLILAFQLKSRKNAYVRTYANILLITAVLQILLGISTLLMQVPVMLASLHQVGALVLFSVSLFINHRLYAINIRKD